MSKKSFFIGFASGIVLTLVALFVIGVIIQNYETNVQYNALTILFVMRTRQKLRLRSFRFLAMEH